MDLRVRLVIELARHEISIGVFVHQGLCFCNRPCHTFGRGCQNQFRTERTKQHFAFFTHAFRHRDCQLVAARRAHHCQTDTRIAAGRFNNYGILTDFARFFGGFNHRFGDAVFHAAAGIEKFQFDGDFGFQTFSQTV